MARCPRGHKVPDHVDYCAYCGAKVRAATPPLQGKRSQIGAVKRSDPSHAPLVVEHSTMAVVSLVSGILGWTFLPLIGSIVAIITGHMAKEEIKNNTEQLGGDSMATIGLVLGYISLGLIGCGCVAGIVWMVLGTLPMFWNNGYY